MISSSSISDFNYLLPETSVAKYPLLQRDESKLLVWEKGQITDHVFTDLPSLLPEGSMLVFNNTRVIRARLQFVKSTGAAIEIFCLEPTIPRDYVHSFAQTSSCCWKCMVGNRKKWKGEVLQLMVMMGKEERGGDGIEGHRDLETGRRRNGETERRKDGETKGGQITNYKLQITNAGNGETKRSGSGEIVVLNAELMEELEGGFEVRFSWDNHGFTFAEILEAAGNIPIPPYLHRESEEIDLTVYQTVYAKIKGSVAAPTAGLHFTHRVLKALADRNISCQELTLHVGAGTFQPVKTNMIEEHRMHTEHFSVTKELITRMIAHSGRLVAVGTTSVRTLESLYWIGCKILQNPEMESSRLNVTQWEPYREVEDEIKPKVALQAIMNLMVARDLTTLETSTQIMILQGYQFRIISGLVTNFHQPQSTLLLLISAILGDEWKRVYAHALANGYRFLSYGDANLYLM